MKVVFKFPLKRLSRQQVLMPADHTILKVAEQHGVITIWAECDTHLPDMRSIDVIVWPTGQALPDDIVIFTYRDTVLLEEGASVWHVYTRTPWRTP